MSIVKTSFGFKVFNSNGKFITTLITKTEAERFVRNCGHIVFN